MLLWFKTFFFAKTIYDDGWVSRRICVYTIPLASLGLLQLTTGCVDFFTGKFAVNTRNQRQRKFIWKVNI
jgi:hypothetical protein